MEQEEINKEIEWLVGSIKRDHARAKPLTIVSIFLIILMVGLLIYCFAYDVNDPSGFEMLDRMGIYIDKSQGLSLTNIIYLAFLGVLLSIMIVLSLIEGKRMEKVEDAREMLRIFDQNNKLVRVYEYAFFISMVAYIIISPGIMKLKFVAVLIVFRQLLFAKMDVKDMMWWLLAIVVVVCMFVMGDFASGYVFIFGIFLAIGVYLYRRYIGFDSEHDGPNAEIEQLRELLKESEHENIEELSNGTRGL
ncbi:MAG: hypothetical protein IKW97_08960 [Muribaculaceae bacterium]|nr:hypothetical protein [Muribaculaceae bacterium]